MSEMRLYDTAGTWLYLIAEERAAFLAVARRKPARDRTLCDAGIAENHAASVTKNRPKSQRFCQVALALSTGRFSVTVGKRIKTSLLGRGGVASYGHGRRDSAAA
jgi:hypothetical protein